MYVRRIEEHPPTHPAAGRLGRHVRHDPRSLAYLVDEADPATLTSVRHARHIPVLDQGDLGSCTGNAAEGCLGTGPFLATIPTDNDARPWEGSGEGKAGYCDELQAVALYSLATQFDEFDGIYPPDDTGSSGLGVAKACQKAGLISGYRHATSLNAALAALASQPVIAGINWYDSFDEPTEDGFVLIADHARVRGGHEIVLDELDVRRKVVWFTNSWGAGWGAQGRAYMTWSDFGRLLSEDGDVTVFTPLTQPAPTPTPPHSDPLAELVDLIKKGYQEILDWARKHGL